MKHTRAATVRRRRLATSLVATGLLTAGIVLAVALPAHSHGHHGSPTSGPDPAATTSADFSPQSGVGTLHRAIDTYVATRKGTISAAIYDRVAKQLIVIHPKVRGRTASIVKADILETLLDRTHGHLSNEQRETATSMIENSDNDSATDLWNQDGGPSGVHAYNEQIGLKQTTPNVDWGLTTTSAADQVALVRELFMDSSPLTGSARRFQRTLMRHVEADQRWGISGGVPDNAVFGNKNGWLPVDEDHDRWAVNSIGWVHGDGKSYVIAVITQHNETEGYGIHTIEHIAQQVWRHATVAPSSN